MDTFASQRAIPGIISELKILGVPKRTFLHVHLLENKRYECANAEFSKGRAHLNTAKDSGRPGRSKVQIPSSTIYQVTGVFIPQLRDCARGRALSEMGAVPRCDRKGRGSVNFLEENCQPDFISAWKEQQSHFSDNENWSYRKRHIFCDTTVQSTHDSQQIAAVSRLYFFVSIDRLRRSGAKRR